MRADAAICIAIAAAISLGGCAVLHHAQIGEIDGSLKNAAVPFDIKVSETGVDLGEAIAIQRALFHNSKAANAVGGLTAIFSLFQLGPRTGAPVYDVTYADHILEAIYQACPSGRATNIASIRETNKYPVVSGEIVRIRGACVPGRLPSSIEGDESEGL
jgi:hypothetical protein